MASTSPWSGTVLVVLWVYGVWYSWLSCGLIGDGSYYLLDAVTVGPYSDIGHERAVPNLLAQLPLAAALAAGVTDLHWLARLQSLGWFALPAILYSLAVLRTRRDPLHQACVVIAIAIVFMTSSFLIVAEHVTAYAIAMMAAAWLVTARRLHAGDGVVLIVLAALSTRSHEVFAYLGPLLAAMTVWTVRRAPDPLFSRGGDISRGRAAFPGLGSLGVACHRDIRRQGLLRVGVVRSPGFLEESGFRSRCRSQPSSSRALPWLRPADLATARPGFSSLPHSSRWCCCRCWS